jgi:hypothetical protein
MEKTTGPEKTTDPLNGNKFNESKYKFDKKEKSVSHKVGDSIERLGEKIMNAGAKKVGRAIYNAGNKIEHMNDNKQNRSS